MKKKLLVFILLSSGFLGGCRTYNAARNPDANDVKGAFVSDVNDIATVSKHTSNISEEVGLLLGLPELISIGGFLSFVSVLAGCFVEKERKERKFRKEKE